MIIWWKRVKVWWGKWGDKIILFLILSLGLVLSFEAGIMVGMARESQPVTIEIPAKTPATTAQADGNTEKAVSPETKPAVTTAKDRCVYVGSRNSTLYHIPTCAPAKRIKPENLVCFTSAEDAEKRGYKAGCLK